MRTGMMLLIAERLDDAGFEAIEVMSSAFYKKCVRDLKDDPWERIRLLKQRIGRTPLRSIRSRSMLAFQMTDPAIADLWLERLAANHDVAFLLTRPDRPRGRGRKVGAPPAKEVAERLGIPVRQPAKLDASFEVDVPTVVVAAYGALMWKLTRAMPAATPVTRKGPVRRKAARR